MKKEALMYVLDQFNRKYEKELEIDKRWVDLTEPYKTHMPNAFGLGEQFTVMGYVTKGAQLSEKYQTDENDQLILIQGQPVIKQFDYDMQVLSCLCLPDMRNTTFHEIYQAIKKGPEGIVIQGHNKELIKSVDEMLNEYTYFNKENDSAFIFAAKTMYQAEKRLSLHKTWLNDIINVGAHIINSSYFQEMILMETVFPQRVLAGEPSAIKRASYMYGKPYHQPFSEEFLKQKVEAFDRYKKE